MAAVVSIGADAWTIGERTVGLTSATEIKGAIAVGDLVKVHALVQTDLSLIAREIEPADEDDAIDDSDDDQDEVELKGFVEAIDGELWTIGGVAIRVTPATEIEDAIAVGDYVEVEAVWADDGVLTALKVKLDDPDDLDDADDGPADSDDDGDEEDEDEDDEDE